MFSRLPPSSLPLSLLLFLSICLSLSWLTCLVFHPFSLSRTLHSPSLSPLSVVLFSHSDVTPPLPLISLHSDSSLLFTSTCSPISTHTSSDQRMPRLVHLYRTPSTTVSPPLPYPLRIVLQWDVCVLVQRKTMAGCLSMVLPFLSLFILFILNSESASGRSSPILISPPQLIELDEFSCHSVSEHVRMRETLSRD